MKAHELRIGNLLNYQTADKDFFLVTRIDWQDLKSISKDEKAGNISYSPIPLTEEWLLKFGFTSEGEGCEGWLDLKNEIENNKVQLRTWINFEYFQEDNGTAFFMLENYDGDDHTTIIPRKFKYVHQLQNLYFALTGEELTIKTE